MYHSGSDLKGRAGPYIRTACRHCKLMEAKYVIEFFSST